MGLFSNFLKSDKKSTSESVFTPNVPDWYKNMLQQNMQRASDLSGRTADQGVAGFTPDQQQGFNLIRGMIGQGNPNLDKAISSISDLVSSSQTTGSDYRRFMDPYRENVIDSTTRKLVEAADAQKQNIRSNAAMMDAFGSGRADMMLSRADEALNEQISDNTYKGMSDAFTWANEMALRDRTTNTQNALSAAQGLAGLTGQQQNYNLADAGALNRIGTQQQQLNQAGMDFGQNQTSWFQGLLNQMPYQVYGATTNQTQTTPGAGWGSQLLGMGLAAAGVMSGNPALMAAGANAGASMAGGSDPYMSAAQNFLPTPQLKSSFFAEGGLVKNYAEGGLVERLSKWADRRLSDYEKNGSLLGGLLSGTHRVKTPTNRIEDIMYAPAMSIAGLLAAPKQGIDALTETAGGLKKFLTQPYSEMEKEALAAQQARQQEVQDNALRAQMEADAARNNQQVPQQPATPVQEVVQAAVEPVINETLAKASGPATESNDSLTMLQKLLGSQGSQPKEEKGGVNMPLLMAGLGMMASDKPFFEAVGTGGLLGATQYAKERDAKRQEETAADKQLKEMLLDLEKTRSQAEIDQRKLEQGEKRIGISDRAVRVQEQQQASRAAESKEIRERIKDLQKQRDLLNKQIVAEIVPANKIQLQSQVDQLQQRIDAMLMNGGDVAQNQGLPVELGDNEIDFGSLPTSR